MAFVHLADWWKRRGFPRPAFLASCSGRLIPQSVGRFRQPTNAPSAYLEREARGSANARRACGRLGHSEKTFAASEPAGNCFE